MEALCHLATMMTIILKLALSQLVRVEILVAMSNIILQSFGVVAIVTH